MIMEVVEDFDFKSRGSKGKYGPLYEAFLELPAGTTVKFARGADFDVEPDTFAVSFRTGLWQKGHRVKVAVREDDVYVILVGPRGKPRPKTAKTKAQVRAVAG